MLLLPAACARAPRPAASFPVPSVRVFDDEEQRFVSLDRALDIAARADVVFFGEQHDDPETHRLELAVLAGIGARRANVILSLEMFERDVQPALDAYLASRTMEREFLAASRPWERYATDYRPLVELAKSRGWPVIASNVPRRLASLVSRKGLAGLDSLPAAERTLAAAELRCPSDDAYHARFLEQMKGHSAGLRSASDSAEAAAMAERFYLAQCLKDETMAEGVAEGIRRGGEAPIVVHFDGAFHSDYGLGTAERVRRRVPNVKSVVMTAVPVERPASADPFAHAGRARFIIFTAKAPAARP